MTNNPDLLGYIVELEAGVWLCDAIVGDPGRTLVLESATVYHGIREAEDALDIAKTFRGFYKHRIKPLYRKTEKEQPNG